MQSSTSVVSWAAASFALAFAALGCSCTEADSVGVNPSPTSSSGFTASSGQPSGSGGAAPGTPGPALTLDGYGAELNLSLGYEEIEQEFWTPPPFPSGAEAAVCTGAAGPMAEAVQQALYFFHVNKSGPGITHTYVQWRGDAHLEDGALPLSQTNLSADFLAEYGDIIDPEGDGVVDMAGGYYDAGDFLKIGITMNFMVSSLGWSMWEFPEAYRDTGLEAEALGVLRWFSDFAIKNTYVENPDEPDPWQWRVVAYGHQVGLAVDHECGWMPPELRRQATCPRSGVFATRDAPHANVSAGAAAALALTGWLFRERDPEYATRCLNHAIALYEFAKLDPSSNYSVDGGLYVSEDGYDDLAWAAVWLHEVLPEPDQPDATALTAMYAAHKADYLDDLIGSDNWIEKFRGQGPDFDNCLLIGAESCWDEQWTHVWNSLRSGVFVKVAAILARKGNQFGTLAAGIKNIARDDSLGWVIGPHTEGGFAKKVDVSWGSARYNSAGQFVALVYARTFPDDVIPDSGDYVTAGIAGQNTASVLTAWAKTQYDYLLGDNPLGQSYMQGFGDDYASYAHHAASHASIYGECGLPEESKHIIYGALVSGPNSGDDHSDDRCDFGANEVTIDYNGAFVGALAGNYAFNGVGQCPDPDFPPVEPPQDEFYTESRINTTSPCRSQVEITLVNETAHPPRFERGLTVRYYIDATELIQAGIDPSTVTASVIYENWPSKPTQLSALRACSLNTTTYYFEMAHPYDFWGRQVRLEGPRTLTLDIGVADGGTCTWNPANDWGFAPLTAEVAKSPTVPAYREGRLVWGQEPECDEPPKKVVPPVILR